MKRVIQLIAIATAWANLEAFACEAIKEDNYQLSLQIAKQEETLSKFVNQLSRYESKCQSKQTSISKAGGQAASAESCEALKEFGSMNEELSSSSVECTNQLQKVTDSISSFSTKFVEITERDLEETVKLDNKLPNLQKACGAELAKTRKLQERASLLLAETKHSIEKSKEAFSNYADFSVQTREFMLTSEAARIRCGIDKSSPQPEMISKGKFAIASAQNSPDGALKNITSTRENSTITGNARKIGINSEGLLAKELINANLPRQITEKNGHQSSSGNSSADHGRAEVGSITARENLANKARIGQRNFSQETSPPGDVIGEFLRENAQDATAQAPQPEQIGSAKPSTEISPSPSELARSQGTSAENSVLVLNAPAGKQTENQLIQPYSSGSSITVTRFVPTAEEIALANSGITTEITLFQRVHQRINQRMPSISASAD